MTDSYEYDAYGNSFTMVVAIRTRFTGSSVGTIRMARQFTVRIPGQGRRREAIDNEQ